MHEVDGYLAWDLITAAYIDGDVYGIATSDGPYLYFDSPTAKVIVSRDHTECVQ